MIDFLLSLATVVALIMFIIGMVIFGITIIVALVNICVETIKEIREGDRDMNVTDVSKEDECCCTCIHNKRTFDKEHHCTCTCELDGHRIGYVANFESVCEEWEGSES